MAVSWQDSKEATGYNVLEPGAAYFQQLALHREPVSRVCTCHRVEIRMKAILRPFKDKWLLT